MTDVLVDTLLDALKMLPFLVIVYLVIEFIEHKAVDKIRAAFANERLGVISAAALGLFPQCGFSVAAANLYAEKLITAGTLVAVFISTSDEAIPIFASNADSAAWLLPLLAIKFLYAIIAGFAVNLLFKVTKLDKTNGFVNFSSERVHEDHHCSHCDSTGSIIRNALYRAMSIFLFILAISFVLNLAIYYIGEDRLAVVLMSDNIAQPFIAALIGLIPNCAASVVLSELFVSGTLSFGSLTAGLCSGAGIGLLVLFRVNRNMKQNLTILASLYLLSALIGVVLQLII